MKPLGIALWNANGLAQHKNELEFVLNNQDVQVMLISETHFINKNFLKVHSIIHNILVEEPMGALHLSSNPL